MGLESPKKPGCLQESGSAWSVVVRGAALLVSSVLLLEGPECPQLPLAFILLFSSTERCGFPNGKLVLSSSAVLPLWWQQLHLLQLGAPLRPAWHRVTFPCHLPRHSLPRINISWAPALPTHEISLELETRLLGRVALGETWENPLWASH